MRRIKRTKKDLAERRGVSLRYLNLSAFRAKPSETLFEGFEHAAAAKLVHPGKAIGRPLVVLFTSREGHLLRSGEQSRRVARRDHEAKISFTHCASKFTRFVGHGKNGATELKDRQKFAREEKLAGTFLLRDQADISLAQQCTIKVVGLEWI